MTRTRRAALTCFKPSPEPLEARFCLSSVRPALYVTFRPYTESPHVIASSQPQLLPYGGFPDATVLKFHVLLNDLATAPGEHPLDPKLVITINYTAGNLAADIPYTAATLTQSESDDFTIVKFIGTTSITAQIDGYDGLEAGAVQLIGVALPHKQGVTRTPPPTKHKLHHHHSQPPRTTPIHHPHHR